MPISKTERERRHTLLQIHTEAENDHDIDAVMATFSQSAVMVFNGQRFEDLESIRLAHIGFGMSQLPGSLAGVRQVFERVSCSDHHILVEGRMLGRHVGSLFGYPPSNQDVDLYYVAAYRFDPSDLLVEERVVMNVGPITLPYALSLQPPVPAAP